MKRFILSGALAALIAMTPAAFADGLFGGGGGSAVGTVFATGTPTAGQAAQWTDATHIQGVDAFDVGIDTLTAASPTIDAASKGRLIKFNRASAQAVTLPLVSVTGFGLGWSANACTVGAGTATVSAASLINGLSSIVLKTGDCVTLVSDGVTYTGLLSPGSAWTLSAALMIGGGSGSPPTTTTTGTGVLTALGITAGASGGILTNGGGPFTIVETAGTSALTITGATQTTNKPLIDGAQTWNAAGVVMMADRINVTSTVGTTSSVLSALIERQYNGSTWFRVGATSGPYATMWLGAGITPTANNYTFAALTNSLFINAAGALGAINFNINNGANVFQIDGAGSGSNPNVVVGSAALATGATTGFLYMTSMPGAPTGNATAYTGRSPIIWDSTNKKLCVRDSGSTWVCTAALS